MGEAQDVSEATEWEKRRQAFLLKDVICFSQGVRDKSWFVGISGILPELAQAAYDERTLPAGTLDPDRLAVLADALEDAGCSDAAILEHLRGPGPHVRGFWPLDLVLGKQ